MALNHLESVTTEPLLIEEAFERRRLWQDSGLFYSHCGRLAEAIELFSRLHEKISEVRARRKNWAVYSDPARAGAGPVTHTGKPVLPDLYDYFRVANNPPSCRPILGL
jgi:hypothetical protein